MLVILLSRLTFKVFVIVMMALRSSSLFNRFLRLTRINVTVPSRQHLEISVTELFHDVKIRHTRLAGSTVEVVTKMVWKHINIRTLTNNPEPITELAPRPDPPRSISEERAGRIERGQVGERGERPARE